VKAVVTLVTSRGEPETQEWTVMVTRIPDYLLVGSAPPVSDMPDDIQEALGQWLGLDEASLLARPDYRTWIEGQWAKLEGPE
jgi:hypothetical protein